jgi:hypothetical protein
MLDQPEDRNCFNRGGVCRCQISQFGKECERYRAPSTVATSGAMTVEVSKFVFAEMENER